jgi:hypothetical protein
VGRGEGVGDWKRSRNDISEFIQDLDYSKSVSQDLHE